MSKLNEFKVYGVNGATTIYTMTEHTIPVTSNTMDLHHCHIRGTVKVTEGGTKVGVNIGVHTKWAECKVAEPVEVMNDLLTELIEENGIKFL